MRINRLQRLATRLTQHPKFPLLLLAAITALAAVLRLYKLGEWSFWIDEIFTINRAQAHYGSIDLIIKNIPPVRNWIPTSVILTAGAINLFGVSEWSVRITPAVMAILTFPIFYFSFRKIIDKNVLFISLLLLAVSTWHLEWSQNARFYTNLMLFYTLALISFFYGIERDRPIFILFYIVFFYLAGSERLFAAFLMPVVVSYILILKFLPFEKPAGYRARNIILTLIPIFAGLLVELLSLAINKTSRFLGDFDWFLQYNIDDPFRLLIFIVFELGVPLVSFALLTGIYLLIKKNRLGLLLLLNAVLPVVLLMALNPILFTKTRYVFFTLPSWIILVSTGIWEVYSGLKAHGKILAIGLFMIFFAHSVSATLLYYQVNNGNRLDWRAAFEIANQRRSPTDELVTWWPQWEGVYWDKEVVLWENLLPEFVVNSRNQFWFILDNEIIWGNLRMKSWIERNAELIDVLYLRREDDAHIKVYLYQPRYEQTITNSEELPP